VPKEQKLPSLYLLDSIVKNIGGEYVKYFSARLPEVFCKAYQQVDPAAYTAMQHLFWTWRGVFPSSPLHVIEAELNFSLQSKEPVMSSQPSRPIESSALRSGHGIHVNPKYLEAQHQLLMQSSKSRADGVVGESNGSAQIRDMERPDAKGFPNAQPQRLPVRFWDCNPYVLIFMYYVRSL
jgi:pre-mRNA cleavage complex 2 protein Pcf11